MSLTACWYRNNEQVHVPRHAVVRQAQATKVLQTAEACNVGPQRNGVLITNGPDTNGARDIKVPQRGETCKAGPKTRHTTQ